MIYFFKYEIKVNSIETIRISTSSRQFVKKALFLATPDLLE